MTAIVEGCSWHPDWLSVAAALSTKAIGLNRLMVMLRCGTGPCKQFLALRMRSISSFSLSVFCGETHRHICTMPAVATLPYLPTRELNLVLLASCPCPAGSGAPLHNWAFNFGDYHDATISL
jgi:hypothetical protein